MPRYIDADALQKQLQKKKAGAANIRFTEGFNEALLKFKSMIHGAETADVVPVVRCEDCVKRRTKECALYCGTEHFRGEREAMTWCGAMYNDDFGCVRGADMRRESETTERERGVCMTTKLPCSGCEPVCEHEQQEVKE